MPLLKCTVLEAPSILEPFQDKQATRVSRHELWLADLYLISPDCSWALETNNVPVLYDEIVAVFLVIRTPRVSGPGVELVIVVFSRGDSFGYLF